MRSDSARAVESGLGAASVWALAGLAGLAVANIYYAQPLLADIAADFSISGSQSSQLVTLSTAGYALGLLLVVPLGDLRQPRTIFVALMSAVGLLQLICAVAPDFVLLAVASFVMSMCAVGAPLLVAFGATLAAPELRAATTGRIMSGVLMGVLLARTGGGLVAALTGSWRWTYGVAAVLAMVLAVAAMRWMPTVRRPVSAETPTRVTTVAVGTLALLKSTPVLRLRCLIGFLTFAGFSALWAALPLRLAAAPYHFDAGAIGLFGLVGAAGALGARVVGPAIDRGHERQVSVSLLAVLAVAWALFGFGSGVLVVMIVGVVLLDLAVQGAQVANLGVVLAANPAQRSRVTTAYTTTYFIGGAGGAAAAGGAYALIGWGGVCSVGAVLALSALALRIAEPALLRRQKAGSSAGRERSSVPTPDPSG